MSEYWRRRALEREADINRLTTQELNESIKRYYESTLASLESEIAALYGKYAREGALPAEELRRLIRGAEYRRWRLTLEEYVKQAALNDAVRRELLILIARSRITRLEMLHSRTLMEVSDLAMKLEEKAASILTKAYEKSLYGGLYDYSGGMQAVKATANAALVSDILSVKWRGGNYSERIWRDKAKLTRELESALLQAVHRGTSIQKLSKAMARRLEVSYNNTERLIRTEVNYIQNVAALKAIRDSGFTHYKYVAAYGPRTCSRCSSLNGKVFNVEDSQQGENYPPIHPRCRCTVIADFQTTTFDTQRFSTQKLPEGDYNLTVRRQVQNRHIAGTREHQQYIEKLAEGGFKPSILAPGVNVAELIYTFHGKGVYDPNPKDGSPREIVDTGRIIGQYWDSEKQQYIDTTFIEIVYSKRGAHIYPVYSRKE